MWHTHRFLIPRTNRSVYEPVLWLHALTEPPPFLHEEDWTLVEHLRTHGQFESGAITNPHESIFDRPIFTRSSAPAIDGNANERIAHEIAAERKMRKQLRAKHRQAVLEAARQSDRARARAKLAQEQRRAEDARDREANELAAQRKQEQRRREWEWKAFAPQQKPAPVRKPEGPNPHLAYNADLGLWYVI